MNSYRLDINFDLYNYDSAGPISEGKERLFIEAKTADHAISIASDRLLDQNKTMMEVDVIRLNSCEKYGNTLAASYKRRGIEISLKITEQLKQLREGESQ